MQISLSDPVLVPELLAHLRGRGCIAYATGVQQVIEVLGRDGTMNEPVEVRRLVAEWHAGMSGVTVRIAEA